MTNPTVRFHVAPARSHAELAVAAALFREYVTSLPFPLDYQGFEQEVANLPGKYAEPMGCIVLAWRQVDGQSVPVGCIAMRPLATESLRTGDIEPVCEMKRMYVKPSARGTGLGRVLAEQLLTHAKAAGYRMMKLDTESTFVAATTLYRSLGFADCERYNDDPQPDTIWMRLRL